MSDFKNINKKLEAMERYLKGKALTVIGTEAVNHFKQSFVDEGFTDKSLEKWDNVKRRDSSSAWYGYQSGANANVPSNHPKRHGAQSKWKRRKDDSITNYSPSASKRRTLNGPAHELMKSIKWKPNADGKSVTIFSALAYAQIHNEGGTFKVFGKKTATMPKRQFMGDSKVLQDKIKGIIINDLKQILK